MSKTTAIRRTRHKAKRRSLFITFEGIDGCGKSTQIGLAERLIRAQGFAVKCLREPGSTAVSERIRRILLDRKIHMNAATELFLYEAARAEIVAGEIKPALKAGYIVLCDRFYDSTTAYQGYGRGLDIKTVKGLHRVAVGNVKPDMTFVFDVDIKTAFKRRGRKLDRLESQSRAFFRRVRSGFLEIAKSEPRRVKVVDATPPVDVVFTSVSRHLMRRLNRL